MTHTLRLSGVWKDISYTVNSDTQGHMVLQLKAEYEHLLGWTGRGRQTLINHLLLFTLVWDYRLRTGIAPLLYVHSEFQLIITIQSSNMCALHLPT